MSLHRRACPRNLDRILTHAVSYALLGSVGACGGTATPSADPDGSVTPSVTGGKPTVLPCLPEGESQFEHMQLTTDYDYLALRSEWFPGDAGAQLSSETGVACSQATDQATCLQALDAARPTQTSDWRSCGQICWASGVVMTRGDDVQLFDSAEGLLNLLGAIDTPYEVALIAQAKGYTATCGEARYAQAVDGFTLITTEMIASCPIAYADVTLAVRSNGKIAELSSKPVQRASTGACVGRRPEGLVELGDSDPCASDALPEQLEVGHFFADVAQLEESAVAAFGVIEAELVALGAPRRLRRAARRAASDEVRHTVLSSRLARRYGVAPEHPRIQERPLRSLFELALDNAVEGCVRETYGAACARYQALRSSDSEVRRALAGVAVDEARHAQLSWRIHGWACSQLSPAELARLGLATARAIAELRSELGRDPGEAVRRCAGMPSPAHALAMLDALGVGLWNSGELGLC